jgi:hypothetical protein
VSLPNLRSKYAAEQTAEHHVPLEFCHVKDGEGALPALELEDAWGRPSRIVSSDEMTRLREQRASFPAIAKAVGASPGTVRTRLLCG